jgi:hypothetical protein
LRGQKYSGRIRIGRISFLNLERGGEDEEGAKRLYISALIPGGAPTYSTGLEALMLIEEGKKAERLMG